MGQRDMERSGISEVIRGKLYLAVLHRPEDLKANWLPCPAICFSIDNELVYEPFYADSGPLNLACTYRFCMKLSSLLQEGEQHGRCICFCCSSEPKKKPNGAVLLGAYLVLFEGWVAEAAYTPLSEFEPFLPFRDPTCGISTYHLSVLDCIRAVAKGKKIGWIDFHNFNVKDYEYFEQVENGDLNWIVPNKIVAFSGPGARRAEVCGYRTLVPEDYVEYFKQSGITTIIRLNKRLYDKRRFTEHGSSLILVFQCRHFSCPPERIVQRSLEILEECPGAVAIHCKAGLGRTGVLIGCYLMKNYRFTANEAIGYLRILRPGSVIGPQQHFLRDMQTRMWKAGDALHRQRSDVNRSSRVYVSSRVQDNQSAMAVPCSSVTSPLAALTLTGSHAGCPNKRNVLPMTRSISSKEARMQNELEEVTSVYKPSYLHTRASVSQHSSSRPSFSRGSSLSMSMDACSEQSRRPLSGNDPAMRCPYNLRSRSSLIRSNVDSNGILKNVIQDAKAQAGEGVFTQRTLNAAGQPRKLVVPVGQTGTRDSSPSRRRSSSPLRSSNNQG